MLPILALAAIRGGLKGIKNVKQAEAKQAAEDKKALAEQAKIDAERKHDADMKRLESRLRIGEKQAEKKMTAQTGMAFRSVLSTNQTAPISTIAREIGYEGYDPEAVFSARAPVFDADGELRYYDEDRTIPQLDLLQISLTKRDDPNAAVTQFVNKVSPETMDWWKTNNRSRYNESMSFLTNSVVQLAKEAGTSGVQGVSQGFPRVPSATVQTLITRYGPDVAEQIVRDAMPTIGENVRSYYSSLGWDVAKDAQITPKAVVNPTTGETDIVPEVEDGGVHVKGLDGPKGQLNRENNDLIKPIADITGKKIDKVKANIAAYSEINGRQPQEILDSIVNTRKVFAGSDWFFYPTPGIAELDTKDKIQFRKFWANNGLFSELSPSQSLEMVEALAGPGLAGYRPQDAHKEGVVPSHLGGTPEQFAARKPGRDLELLEAEQKRISTKYGFETADVVNKSQAAKDAIISVDALIYEYENGVSIPGAAGRVVNTIVGARAQVEYFIQAVSSSSMDENKRGQYLTELNSLRESLNVEGLDQVAIANRLRDYHEGVLVYSMAMALQGGNAAARTISDADIERIREILAVGQAMGTTEQKLAVMRSLKFELTRRAALADAYASGKESRVWAAKTSERYLADNDYGGQSVIDVLYKQHVNPNHNPRATTTAPAQGDLIKAAPNGRGYMYRQPNGTYSRQPHPDIQYPAIQQG